MEIHIAQCVYFNHFIIYVILVSAAIRYLGFAVSVFN